jgi:hypothetical protein
MKALAMSGFVRRGVTAGAIAAAILAATPVPGAQAASAGSVSRTSGAGMAAAVDDPASGTILGENPDDGASTTPDERYLAAAVLGWTPRDEIAMSDKDFVIVLFEKADDYFHPEVKKAAHDAFADVNDPDASAAFIRTGIFAADERDAGLKVIRAQRDGERLSAAQEVDWIPGDDDERRVLLRSTNENFLGSLARKAEEGSDVRRGADVAAEGTEAQQLAFIATGVHQAAAVDRARKIEEGRQKELAEQEAKRSREIRGAAIAAALGRAATEFELTLSAERDLIYKIKTETPGTQMKLAAGIAYNSEKPADWRDFLSTGVHLARAADIAEQDRRDKEKREGEVRQILNDATFDKYQPELVAAANKALLADDNARLQFLGQGKEAAAKLDVARPTAYLTVALQGANSKRCVQVAGAVDKPNLGGNADLAPMELWDCNENGRQRWHLMPVNATTFTLFSANSRKCLEVPAAKINDDVRLIQNACVAGQTRQRWTFVDSGTNTVSIRNVGSNKVMTVTGGATANYSAVGQSAAKANSLDQQWRLIDFSHAQAASPPPTGQLMFKGVESGRCINVAGVATPGKGAYLINAPTELWDCNKPAKAAWTVVPIAGNRFALKNRLSNMCLDLSGGAVANGTVALQYTCHQQASQQWVLMSRDAKNGSYQLYNAMTGTHLSVKSGTANAAVLHGWANANRPNQKWIPQPVS